MIAPAVLARGIVSHSCPARASFCGAPSRLPSSTLRQAVGPNLVRLFSVQEILQPASTTRHCPVISALSSDARNKAVPVSSLGSSERPSAD